MNPDTPQILAYEREPYRTELDVAVLEVGDASGRPFAVLDDTILYPEGGGQPPDHGRLGDAAVVDVQRQDGRVRHWLDRPIQTGPANLVLDWSRRFDHMQQHTAQHLLTAIAADRHGWQTTSFHLQPGICDIELDVGGLTSDQLEMLERQVLDEIRADHPITTRRIEPEALSGLDVRTRGLPEGHRGSVRLVEISELDLNTCGGTHLRSTGEIETLKLLETESMRGGTRLFWIAGGRVRQRLAEHEARHRELRRVLGCSDDELIAIATLKLEQAKNAQREQRKLLGQLAELTIDRFLASDQDVLNAHFEPADMGLLQQIAQRFSRAPHRGVALLTASGEKGHVFVVAGGGDCPRDVASLGRETATALNARGGGSGKIFQGKAESLDNLEPAIARLKTSV